ncbi:hypothetical protein ACTWP5_31300 [Streptomyces sp. 4N509B]|uniref:hypothetical protein n=1 Tax=Streptomyces sp. 4N509B TaxID=3457413 RepID=UPI003FD3C0C1
MAAALLLAGGLVLLFLPVLALAGMASQANGQPCTTGTRMPAGGGTGRLLDPAHTTGDRAVVPLSPQGRQLSPPWTEAQARNAATITNVARTRALPPRAAVIAVATAMQESRLNNLDHGDRDSVGLFQQRPSQGWGTPADLTDPVHASGRFFDALLDVPGWRTRPLADVAQAVQRSATPRAYARWEQAAGALVARTWGTHAVTSLVGDCAPDAVADPSTAFSVRNPRTPAQAIAAARATAGQAGWYRMCDRFVAQAYGYAYSGSATANDHWDRLVEQGLAHPGDASPPAGALLFYDTGEAAGHVALYLGGDMVASNDVLDSYQGEGRIVVVHREELTDGHWHLRYRGWAEPGFPGAGGTSTI